MWLVIVTVKKCYNVLVNKLQRTNQKNNNNITFILMKEDLQSHMSYRLFTPHKKSLEFEKWSREKVINYMLNRNTAIIFVIVGSRKRT